MEDEILEKIQQVTAVYKQNFDSSPIQEHNQDYIDQFAERLNQLETHTDQRLKRILQDKIDEANQYFYRYYDDAKQRRAEFMKQTTQNISLADIDQYIEDFNTYCQTNQIEKRIHFEIKPFTEEEIAERIQVKYIPYPHQPITIQPLQTHTEQSPIRDVPSRHSSSPDSIITSIKPLDQNTKETHEKSPVYRPSMHFGSSSSETTDTSLKHNVQEITISFRHSLLSSSSTAIRKDSEPKRDDDQEILVQEYHSDHSRKETPIYQPKPTTTQENSPKRSTHLYVGRDKILTPVLVDTNRAVVNETDDIEIIEYSVDSIEISHDKHQSLHHNTDGDNKNQLVKAYKVLVEKENQFPEYIDPNYSTIMLEKCETKYNCLSSSTKRNELIVFNSKLNVLILLLHEDNQESCHRLYIQWPVDRSPNISDITYCQNPNQDDDRYLISIFDTSQIYLFNRNTLSITELGQLSLDLPLRRIHCYKQSVYCILKNNFLIEYELDENYSKLEFKNRFLLFNPTTKSQYTAYRLLDITADENYLFIAYASDHDGIHLQTIHRKTRQFHSDIVLDEAKPINQAYIRIETTGENGILMYLNGTQRYLKTIDFIHYDKGKSRSEMRRRTTPTNLCFTKDGRLVILHESPYFLAIQSAKND